MPDSPRVRRREPRGREEISRVACRLCNSKKVKCFAPHGLPCRRCVSTGSECILIDSQRGKYRRRNLQHRDSQDEAGHATSTAANQAADSIVARHDQEPIPSGTVSERDSYEPEGTSLGALSRSFEDRAPKDRSAMFYLHIADQAVDSNSELIHDAVKTFYTGESFSLNYVLNDVLAPILGTRVKQTRRLYFPINPGFDPSSSGRQNIVTAQSQLLQERGIWHNPEPKALEKLLETYFTWFHPSFPLVTEAGFREKCMNSQMSLLVLNAMLLVAVTMCEPAEIQALGFSSRHEAREVFYRQAKVLYDADSDPDKVNTVIAVFLMGFWWGGSNDEKDSWHWLGIAISLAQSLGMHRSTVGSPMSTEMSKQWRRIWWCLQIRDSMTSGSIGRPQHFSMNDCDVELLQADDLECIPHAEDSTDDLRCEKRLYACQMAKLSIIFSNIIRTRYAVSGFEHASQKAGLEEKLDEFYSQIPAVLQYRVIDAQSGRGLWAAMLSMAYNFGTILLCRPPSNSLHDMDEQVWGNRARAVQAANETTRIMEDILSSSVVRLCQIHTIPALFNSLSIHVFSFCTSDSIARELAENRARTCMLGLTCLQESWPVSGWILKLFVQIIQRVKRRGLGTHSSSAGLQREIATADDSWLRAPGVTSTNITSNLELPAGSGGTTPSMRHDATRSSLWSDSTSLHQDFGNFPDLSVLDDFVFDLDMFDLSTTSHLGQEA